MGSATVFGQMWVKRVPKPGPFGIERFSMTPRWRRAARAITALLVIVGGLSVEPTTALAANGLDVSSVTTYEISTDGKVHVTADYTLLNTKESTRSGGVTRDFYFSGFTIAVPKSAENVAAVSDGGELGFDRSEFEKGKGVDRVDISMPNLFNGGTRRITVTYDVVGDPPRTPSGDERVNPAYAAFFAFGVGDPDQVEVRIIAPAKLDIETFGPSLQRAVDGTGKVTYSQTAIADPISWAVFVSARNDPALVRNPVEAAGTKVDIRSWPGDTAWADYAARNVTSGLPALAALIGEPVPTSHLDLIESITPYLYGAGGWYQAASNKIEIGEELDNFVMLHELAHNWFNQGLFNDRWMSEGLANEYAALAQKATGETAVGPKPVSLTAPGAQALATWARPTFSTKADNRASEEYGYNTAYYVWDQVRAEIGTDKMAAALGALINHRSAYQPATGLRTDHRSGDWQRLLDLLQNAGGSAKAEELFRTYVLTSSNKLALDGRTAARASWAELRTASAPWDVPEALLAALERWDWADAKTITSGSYGVLEHRKALTTYLAAHELTYTDNGGGLYAKTDVGSQSADPVLQLLDGQLTAAQTLVEAEEAVKAPRDREQTAGLIGQDPAGLIDQARIEFNKGNTAVAVTISHDAKALIDGSVVAGKRRIHRDAVHRNTVISTVAGGAFLLVLVALLVWRRARRGPSSRPVVADNEPDEWDTDGWVDEERRSPKPTVTDPDAEDPYDWQEWDDLYDANEANAADLADRRTPFRQPTVAAAWPTPPWPPPPPPP
jgi:hypothetical protein